MQESSGLRVMKAGWSLTVETWLEIAEPKVRRKFLGRFAAKLNKPNGLETVVGLSEIKLSEQEAEALRNWLRERLSVWIARFGA